MTPPSHAASSAPAAFPAASLRNRRPSPMPPRSGRRATLLGTALRVACLVLFWPDHSPLFPSSSSPSLARAMRIHKAWTSKHWCKSVIKPHWPFAYAKLSSQTMEPKGRVVSSFQDMGHECVLFGARTKCHRCEDIVCGDNLDEVCSYQLQGVDWFELPKNIPTASDVPWAIDGKHRNDFGRGTSTCLMLTGGGCTDPMGTSFGECRLRCWGHGNPAKQNPIAASPFGVRWQYDKHGNQQGSLMTHAGDGVEGHQDGAAATARFNKPAAAAVDANQNVYVADTNNHCIRRIDFVTKMVTTIAGTPGIKGKDDGAALTKAQFANPMGIALYVDAATGKIVVIISDTGNNRIRKLVDSTDAGGGTVSTLSGNKNLIVKGGFGDGSPIEARFNEPRGIACSADGFTYVADKNNHLIRRVAKDGTTTTVAGRVEIAEKGYDGGKMPGCPPPCLQGMSGHLDGNLTHAQFYFPSDVAMGPANTIIVADSHRVRRVSSGSIGGSSTIAKITSLNRVVTIAGSHRHGEEDGIGQEASFNGVRGVATTSDGRVYVADYANHRVRSITPQTLISETNPVKCTTRMDELVRPGGCNSYDVPVDAHDLKASPITANIYYNYGVKLTRRDVLYPDVAGEMTPNAQQAGKRIPNCQGSAPVDVGVSSSGVTLGPQKGTGAIRVDIQEDTDIKTQIKVICPANCGAHNLGAGGREVVGDGLYRDTSSVCVAAIHAGILVAATGGHIALTIEEGAPSYGGAVKNGITSLASATEWVRSFTIKKESHASVIPDGKAVDLHQLNIVQTVAGLPNAPLKTNRGFKDASPAIEGLLDGPVGVATYAGKSLTAANYLFVVDTNNNRIRRLTATCTKVCENGGSCIGPDVCQCATGWAGPDCTSPMCAVACAAKQVCAGANRCVCKPGWGNFPSCDLPLCVQDCANGGCTAPDTCTCTNGWFDANCTTPVCGQTCGNGGNCTSPNMCSCPSEWRGHDCRTPVCTQSCRNGGICVAPDSCSCPVDWQGHDCSLPVCNQGIFFPDPSKYVDERNEGEEGEKRDARRESEK